MTVKRYLATLYRGRWLYFPLLALLLGASGFGTYYLSQTQYEATARIWVEKPVLDNVLTPNAPLGYIAPPAQQQADKLDQLLQTDSFMVDILKHSPAAGQLTNIPDQDRSVIRSVRSRLAITALGSNTVRIAFTDKDPVLSKEIVDRTIAEFRTWSLKSQLEQNSLERQFYEKQLKIYEEQMNDAQKRVDEFQKAHPFPDPSSPQYLELTRLQRELEGARSLFNVTRTKVEQAAAAQSLVDTSRQAEFRILDAPMVPTKPSATLSRIVKYLGLGIGASFGLILLAIVLSTLQDTTVRTADDLRALNLPVLEVIPHLNFTHHEIDDDDRRPERPARTPRTPQSPPSMEESAAT